LSGAAVIGAERNSNNKVANIIEDIFFTTSSFRM